MINEGSKFRIKEANRVNQIIFLEYNKDFPENKIIQTRCGCERYNSYYENLSYVNSLIKSGLMKRGESLESLKKYELESSYLNDFIKDRGTGKEYKEVVVTSVGAVLGLSFGSSPLSLELSLLALVVSLTLFVKVFSKLNKDELSSYNTLPYYEFKLNAVRELIEELSMGNDLSTKGVEFRGEYMTLRDLKPCHIATVDRVLGEDALMCRIMDMGITKGTQLTAKCCAPFGDPMMIELRGYCLMIRHKDAERVRQEHLDRQLV